MTRRTPTLLPGLPSLALAGELSWHGLGGGEISGVNVGTQSGA